MTLTACCPSRTAIPSGPRRSDGLLRQFSYFVGVGGASNVLYALAFTVLHTWGFVVANIAGVVLSTVLANELHRRLTFRATDRVGWRTAQWEGGALGLLGLALSSVALAALHWWLPAASAALQVLLVVAVSALAGVVRFLVLRGWVFGTATVQPALA